MKLNLSPYADKKICVAVSGGKDSMALLHYLKVHGEEFGITVCALNCDHGIRGEASERDSAFVAAYCGGNSIPLRVFMAEKGVFKGENDAREWRRQCYFEVLGDGGADLIATAHHANDNAETVLFNLARGSALAGMTGIADDLNCGLIRPLISVTRKEIDDYIEENAIPFVTDESNLSDEYTRNKIRHNVLPALEEAVPGAAENIYRFSRLAAEDEEYFNRQVLNYITLRPLNGVLIKPCTERVIFRRVARFAVADTFKRQDYTAEHLNRLYELQSAENGKKFEFLGLTATKEEGGVAVTDGRARAEKHGCAYVQFKDNLKCSDVCEFAGQLACAEYEEYEAEATERISRTCLYAVKSLRFDLSNIPETAVIRFRKKGDKFTKFGGGTKSLSDYLTDKKVPQSLRDKLPLVCDGSEVLIVGGVEISDKIKVDESTTMKGVFICYDPFKI